MASAALPRGYYMRKPSAVKTHSRYPDGRGNSLGTRLVKTYCLNFRLLLRRIRLRYEVIFRFDDLSIFIPLHSVLLARKHGIRLGLLEETTLVSSLTT